LCRLRRRLVVHWQRTTERQSMVDNLVLHYAALRHLLVHWNVTVFHRLGYSLLHQRCSHHGQAAAYELGQAHGQAKAHSRSSVSCPLHGLPLLSGRAGQVLHQRRLLQATQAASGQEETQQDTPLPQGQADFSQQQARLQPLRRSWRCQWVLPAKATHSTSLPVQRGNGCNHYIGKRAAALPGPTPAQDLPYLHPTGHRGSNHRVSSARRSQHDAQPRGRRP